jgi:hypothetical protein
MALREAQATFNEASRETMEQYKTQLRNATVETTLPPESPEEKYQRVVYIIDKRVLEKVKRDDLEVTAYALKAFALWRLDEGNQAKIAAVEGLDLYKRTGLTTNRRDYGMLLILGGLVDYTEVYNTYQAKIAEFSASYIPKPDAEEITRSMAAALKKIDVINSKMNRAEPIVVYANYQELRIIRNILDVWEKVRSREDKLGPYCSWFCRGDTICKENFPDKDYPGKDDVKKLRQEIEVFKKEGCTCP